MVDTIGICLMLWISWKHKNPVKKAKLKNRIRENLTILKEMRQELD